MFHSFYLADYSKVSTCLRHPVDYEMKLDTLELPAHVFMVS